MRAAVVLFVLVTYGALLAPRGAAHDWGRKYSTGRKGSEFESCCGHNDCHTAESLGYPRITRLDDGGYDVKIGKTRLHYDFPAVHISEDDRTWLCYIDDPKMPEPLCLFLPPGII